jgi:5-methylcytosine-specific restriction endonuclease McrA
VTGHARRHTPRRPGLDDQRYRDARAYLKRTGPNVCHRCHYPIDLQLSYPHPLSWSADHKVPRSQLAASDSRQWHISNLLEAHLRCNSSRGAQPLDQQPRLRTSREW